MSGEGTSGRDRTWRESQVEHFRKHPEEIPLYLNVALEEAHADGDRGAFMAALRTIAEAKGGLGELADRLETHRPNLYRTLSEEGNPRLATLASILQELGFRLAVQPTDTAAASRTA